MAETVQVLTRYPKGLLKEIDKLVKQGLYSSRSDALRDAARILIRMQRGVIRTKKTGLKLQKEGNKKMRELYAKSGKKRLLKDLKRIKV